MSKSQVQEVMTCESASCASHGDGHALSAIRLRAAAATPSKWVDAIVADVEPTGWVAIDLFDEGERVHVWHHDALGLQAGTPVALHSVYRVLAVGRARLSVSVARAAS